jgi:hypothetical protein
VRGTYRDAGLDEGELVRVLRQVGKQVGKPRAAFAVLLPAALVRNKELADSALSAGFDSL